jgi:cell division protein FtsW (lipid II flippase)
MENKLKASKHAAASHIAVAFGCLFGQGNRQATTMLKASKHAAASHIAVAFGCLFGQGNRQATTRLLPPKEDTVALAGHMH